MQGAAPISIRLSTYVLASVALRRNVTIDLYCPANPHPNLPQLLLLNDGQDLHQFNFVHQLEQSAASGISMPLVCVGIHAGANRIQEYGIAGIPDYAGRGALAAAYQSFVLEELLPFVHQSLNMGQFAGIGFAGFSLGGLSAFATAWQNPGVFQLAAACSGSFWWRSRELGPGYSDHIHRIMHQQVRSGQYHPGQRFYFTTGSLDETADRNNNGVIDSIDDTTDLVQELLQKGYSQPHELCYRNYEHGRHDVATWGKVMPAFLQWAYGGH